MRGKLEGEKIRGKPPTNPFSPVDEVIKPSCNRVRIVNSENRIMAPIDTETSELERAVLEAAVASRGHFRYESGHHGDLWLDLDRLFVDARRTRGWVSALAQ